MEVVEVSREVFVVVVVAGGAGVDVVVDVVDATGAMGIDAGIGSAVSRVALGAAAEGLSSIVGAKVLASREMLRRERVDENATWRGGGEGREKDGEEARERRKERRSRTGGEEVPWISGRSGRVQAVDDPSTP